MEDQKPEEQNQNSNFSFRLFYNSLIDAVSFIPFFAVVVGFALLIMAEKNNLELKFHLHNFIL